jgi:plastocyanin
MKKLLVVLAILFIGILLAGCTSQPAVNVTTTPTPVPTTEVATIVPTPEPTKEIVVIAEPTTPAPTSTPTPAATEQPSVTITFTSSMTIMPGTTVTIPVGGKVIWKNDDPFKPHGVQAVDLALAGYLPNGGAENQIPYGKTIEITFDKVGAYDYTTIFQPKTDGKIIVTAK